jgi:hypothetical protein
VKLKLDNNINAISIVANVQVLLSKKVSCFELHLAFENRLVDDNPPPLGFEPLLLQSIETNYCY